MIISPALLLLIEGESGKTYPGPILLGPWIIAVNSPIAIFGTATRSRSVLLSTVGAETHSYLPAADEQSLGHLDMAGHSDLRVGL